MRVRIGSLIVLAILLAGTPTFAQDVTAGIKGGVNLAKVSEEGETFKWLTGGVVGAFVRVPVTNSIGIQPEVLYSMQGTKAEDGNEKATIKLNYVVIPILLNARLGSGSTRPFVNVGPVFGFRTKAEFKSDGQTRDFSDEVKKRDVGILFGGGVEAGKLILEARYTLGLVQIAAQDSDKVKSQVITFLAGFGF